MAVAAAEPLGRAAGPRSPDGQPRRRAARRRSAVGAMQEARPDHLDPRRHEDEAAERVEDHQQRQQQAHLGLELEVGEPPEDRARDHRAWR